MKSQIPEELERRLSLIESQEYRSSEMYRLDGIMRQAILWTVAGFAVAILTLVIWSA